MVSADDAWLDDYEEGSTSEEVLDRLKRGALLWDNDATPEEIAQAMTERFGPPRDAKTAGTPEEREMESWRGVHEGASGDLPPFDATGEPVGPNAEAWKEAVGWADGRVRGADSRPSASDAWLIDDEFPTQRDGETRQAYLERLARTATDWVYDTPTVPPVADDVSGD